MKVHNYFSIIFLLLSSLSSIAQNRSIVYFKYNNLTFTNNKTIVNQSIDHIVNDNIHRISSEYILPDSLTTILLGGLDSLNIDCISSNNTIEIDGIPFNFSYQFANDSLNQIHGYRSGMKDHEKTVLNQFENFISSLTSYHYSRFIENLTDGEYQLKGVMGNSSLFKNNGIWYNHQDFPLVIFDGKMIHPKDKDLYMNKPTEYEVRLLKGAEAALYGTRAMNGVIIINTKK